MGKALVFDGLVVANPLKTVTFVNPKSVIDDYISFNSSINDDETTALSEFVDGLVADGVWGKIDYFYPCLGDKVDDCLLNVKNPSSDDVFSKANRSLLEMDGRTMQVIQIKSAESVPVTYGSKFKSLDLNDFGVVSAIYMNNKTAIYNTMKMKYVYQGGESSNNIGLGESGDGTTYPAYIGISGATTSTLKATAVPPNERVIFAGQKNNELYMYVNGGEKATSTLTSGASSSIFGTGTLFNYVSSAGGSNRVNVNFYAITKALSDSDIAKFNSRLTTFLTAVGKKA